MASKVYILLRPKIMVFFEIVKWEFLNEAFGWRFFEECGGGEGVFELSSVYILMRAKIQKKFETVKLFGN
jgi:hypothetical protein